MLTHTSTKLCLHHILDFFKQTSPLLHPTGLQHNLGRRLTRSVSVIKSVRNINTSIQKRGIMTSQKKAPYVPQDPKDVQKLVTALEHGVGNRQKKDYRAKKTSYTLDGTNNLSIDSWKFNDWDYKRDDLPTYARGLFTCKRSDGTPEIATRGYDKFFNIDEVNDTQWRNIEEFTRGPYELSVKENGCIIFMSGIENNKLLVCSKHSTGPRSDTLSHAVVGERWVDKHLATVGKIRAEFAAELRERNITAVAELCDDEFEEHVLAYDEKTSGLYLHGINVNVPHFETYSSSLVHRFADEWGFKKAEYVVKEDVADMRAFLERCAETGSWEGRDTEGFVIRCQKKEHGQYVDWFFKYKFEEPYLMYRQWREATKAMIAGKAPKYKKHVKITEEYLDFARRKLAQTPGLAKKYNQNHGIIKLREDFLNYRGLKGSDIIQAEEADTDLKAVDHNVILVPVATIGCGKTTLGLALTKLFKWGHIQNDNITGKKARPQQFVNQISMKLAEYPVVIADRNNHQKRERKQLIEDMTRVIPDIRFVALHYVHDPRDYMISKIRKVTRDRVLSRGDNHQTIHAGSKGQDEITSIMDGFLTRFEPLDPNDAPDSSFDEIINLDVLEDSRHNLDMVVNALHKAYPEIVPEVPSAETLDEAIHAAMNDYSVELKHDLSFKSEKKDRNAKQDRNTKQQQQQQQQTLPKRPKIEYFAVKMPTQSIINTLETAFSSQDSKTAQFFHQLQQTRRIQPSFHITLMHRASTDSSPQLWNELMYKYEEASQKNWDPILGDCEVKLQRIVWDGRLICIQCELLGGQWKTSNAFAHVTVGTAGNAIKPKESNDVLIRLDKEGVSDENGIQVLEVEGKETMWGQVKAVSTTWR